MIHYVITAGEYSDYHIITITSDEKIAVELARRYDGEIQTFLDGEVYINQMPIWEISFEPDGEYSCDLVQPYILEAEKVELGKMFQWLGWLRIYVEARTKE